jgi:general L-amino acid transport system permease protein
MRDGALGLSTGLFYVPGTFTSTAEVIALAKVAGRYGGIHTSHQRDDASKLLDSVRETIAIGEGGGLPTQITHHKVIGKANWGRSADALRLVDGIARWARRRREATGQPFHTVYVTFGLLVGLPLVALLATGVPIAFEHPEMGRFKLDGGLVLLPELVALTLALSTYTAAFIAETVRAGVLSVSHGQVEAAHALGLGHGQTLRLVVVPQALRVIIPPLTSQYLNLTKNSSLAVAIGYPDFVNVFTGIVLNQTGQAVEVIAMTMAVYLTLSLLTSAFLNWYNRRMALVER